MKSLAYFLNFLLAIILSFACSNKKPSAISVDLVKEGAEISDGLWGIFYEEINRAGDGGLYPEMIYNRGFEEKNFPSTMTYQDGFIIAPALPSYANQQIRNWRFQYNAEDKSEGWKLETGAGSKAEMEVVTDKPLDPGTPHSLLIDITGSDGNVALINEGFMGISVAKGEKYDLLFHVRAPGSYNGKIVASILGADGNVIGKNEFSVIINGQWNPYSFSFTSDVTDNKAKLSLQFTSKGKLWLDYISLLPQSTFKNHGLRTDIAQILADLKPAFVRWPGGCIVEGCTMENRVKWWESIGPHISRTGQFDLWGYFNTYGFGYHDFLQFCEDIGAKGMFVANAGVSCSGRNGDYYEMEDMPVLVQQTLDAIEYAIGDVSTKWGAERAKNGHPEVFPLKYVEIGNENSGPVYGERYNMIFKAIKEKYPQILCINTSGLNARLADSYDMDKIEMIDPHWYQSDEFFYSNTRIFDTVPRGKYDIYVGEFAVNQNVGTGNLKAALGEAAYMLGMERNSDIVKMASYAPLLENVNYRDWSVNLIRFKNDSVFGRSSYYVQQMFSLNRPDVNLSTTLDWIPPAEKITGSIGFGSLSSVELKNIILSKGSKVVYTSDFPADTSKWNAISGKWSVNEGAYCAKAEQPEQPDFSRPPQGQRGNQFRGFTNNVIILKDQQFENVTIAFSVKRENAFNGLNIRFGAADDNNYFQITISDPGRGRFPGGGGFPPPTKQQGPAMLTATLGQAIGGPSSDPMSRMGFSTLQLGRFEKQFSFDADKWHDVKITVNGKLIDLVIDGISIGQIEYVRPQRQFAIGGYDRTTNEVIIKVVNGEGYPFNTTINLENAEEVDHVGQIIELFSASNLDENNFKEPKKIVPQISEYAEFSYSFEMAFKPYSFTILRIKASKLAP